MQEPDVSIILNLHAEGNLADKTVRSIMNAVKHADLENIKCEILCILDKPDHNTVIFAESIRGCARIYETNFGDLSSARNFGAAKALGRYTAFIDGDDLFGQDWITAAYKLLNKKEGEKLIAHPRVNMYFGKSTIPYFMIHPDMRYEAVSLVDILASNVWTALSFAMTDIYRDIPFIANDIENGRGYEDWRWNIETIMLGYCHVTPQNTIHFIRIKEYESLVKKSNSKLVIPSVRSLNLNIKSILDFSYDLYD